MISSIKAAEIAQEQIVKLTKLELAGCRGMSRDDEKWHITVEMLEKKSIPDAQDLLGIYDVTVDEEGNVLNFERTSFRKRGET